MIVFDRFGYIGLGIDLDGLDRLLIGARYGKDSHRAYIKGMTDQMLARYIETLRGIESRFEQVMKRNGKV